MVCDILEMVITMSMRYYPALAKKGCFTLQDLTQLTGHIEYAKWIASEYISKRYIERVRKNLYVAIDGGTMEPIPSRYQVASNITYEAVVAYRSALEYYGFLQKIDDIYLITPYRFRDFSYRNLMFHYLKPRISPQFSVITDSWGVTVTTIERTVIECIDMLEKIIPLHDLLNTIKHISSWDTTCLLKCMELYNKQVLWQKVGFILQNYSNIPYAADFFHICKQHIPHDKTYIYNRRANFRYYKEWNIIAPNNFADLLLP